MSTELVLDDQGQLQEVNRVPGENEVCWRPLPFILITSLIINPLNSIDIYTHHDY